MTAIDELQSHLDLLKGKNFGIVTTVNRDGTPQSTPVWIDYSDKKQIVLFNTAKGRKKYVNMKERPHISICILDQKNPYRYVTIEGTVEWMTEDGAIDHINFLAKKYMDKDEYPYLSEDERRVKVGVQPTNIIKMG